MSGGHWGYLYTQLEERAGQPLNEVWRLLAAIEHELDYGICCDICYDCAQIRTISALEAYFDTGATSIENSMRILRSSEPECAKCKEMHKRREGTQEVQPRQSATVEIWHDGKLYKGAVYVVEEAGV